MTDEPQVKFRPGPNQRELIDLTMGILNLNQQEAIRVMINHCRMCPSFRQVILGLSPQPTEKPS